MNAMAVEQKDIELQFDPSTVEIISVDQLESPRAISPILIGQNGSIAVTYQ